MRLLLVGASVRSPGLLPARSVCASVAQQQAEMHARMPPPQVNESLTDMAFLNCRPSVIAAAVMYAERRARGIIPFWPSMLAKLSGYDNMSTPELSVAIKVGGPRVVPT